jgi:hypothetical protein
LPERFGCPPAGGVAGVVFTLETPEIVAGSLPEIATGHNTPSGEKYSQEKVIILS